MSNIKIEIDSKALNSLYCSAAEKTVLENGVETACPKCQSKFVTKKIRSATCPTCQNVFDVEIEIL